MPRLDTTLRQEGGTTFRYLVVTVGGYLVDAGVSLALVWSTDVGLVAAAITGFAAAVCANYLAHEFWTFAGQARTGAYASRIARYVLVAGFTLATRIGIIAAFAGYTSSDGERSALIVAAAGGSLVLNYALTRLAVFGERGDESTRPPTKSAFLKS